MRDSIVAILVPFEERPTPLAAKLPAFAITPNAPEIATLAPTKSKPPEKYFPTTLSTYAR